MEGVQWKKEMARDKVGMEKQTKESSDNRRNKRAGMKCESRQKTVRCTLLNGIEHRMRKEEMEEQFNKEVKQG